MTNTPESIMRVGLNTRMVGPEWLRSKQRRVLELMMITNPWSVGLVATAVAVAAGWVWDIDKHKPIIALPHPHPGVRNGQFGLLKVRTMRVGSENCREEVAGKKELWELKERDPRVLPGAEWLRRSGIDEMPQAINILRGEMSLIGPRPVSGDERIRYLEPNLDKEPYSSWAELIHKVKFGITGLWQVLSRNGNFEERLKYDIKYMQDATMASDLRILALTFNPKVLLGGK